MQRINCSAPNIVVIAPFGNFKIAIETTDKTAPFKGMRSTGNNGFYNCFESINSYRETLALKLKRIIEKQPHITAATIYSD